MQTPDASTVVAEPALAAPRIAAVVALLVRAVHALRTAGPAPRHDDAMVGRECRSYLQQVRALQRLSHLRELELFQVVRSAHADSAERDAARREIVRANLWLVPVIVRRYCRSGSVFDDLVAEGNIGLYAALERFDPARGFRFSTYAKWWVVDAVTAAMSANAYPLRVPRKVALTLARRRRGGDAAHDTDDATAPAVQVEALDDAAVDEQHASDPSCDAAPAPEQLVALRQTLQLLTRAVRELPARERRVIEGRYGLDGHPERTLQDIGNELGVTAERVRTLQISAMAMLKSSLGA